MQSEFRSIGSFSQLKQLIMNPMASNSALESRDVKRNVIVVKGNIAEFSEADVLVNPVLSATKELQCSGEISRAFYAQGKRELQKEYERVGPPECFGTDVTVTGPSGTIRAKKIFHPAIGKYNRKKSIELLTRLIKICLNTAESYSMTSIAFPTLGCKRLGYSANTVAQCFAEAARETEIQIYIVAYEDDLYETFRAIFAAAEKPDEQLTNSTTATTAYHMVSSGINGTEKNVDQPVNSITKPIVEPKSRFLPRVVFSTISNDINTETEADNGNRHPVDTVSELPMEMNIIHSAIADLSHEIANKIRELRTNDVKILIEVGQSSLTLTGSRKTLQEVKQRILKYLTEDELKWKNLSYIKSTRGVKAYLLALSQRNYLGFPDYWTNTTFPDLSSAESKRCRLVKGSPEYDAVTAFVMKTWNSGHVGVGDDAVGLTHSNIAIRNIWTIENPHLYINYQYKLKALALKAAHKPFTSVSGLYGEPEIKTKRIPGVECLNRRLISEVNEVYLLHGTSHVQEIIKNGIDSRFSGDTVLFGRGAYFAESSTKSDQYSDQIGMDTRVPPHESLFMFVARVLLGEPFVALEARPKLKKAPCSSLDCGKDTCSMDHPMCDSVIGTRENASTPLLFREFIVYHPDQCYPEFLVEYVRQ